MLSYTKLVFWLTYTTLYSLVPESPSCKDVRSKAMKSWNENLKRRRPMVGLCEPVKCQESDKSLYELQQCCGSTGYCWCVDTLTGNQIEGTDFRIWEDKHLGKCAQRLEEQCISISEGEMIYHEVGDKWEPEPCMWCGCISLKEDSNTLRRVCATPDCVPLPKNCKIQSKAIGQCCPECLDAKPKSCIALKEEQIEAKNSSDGPPIVGGCEPVQCQNSNNSLYEIKQCCGSTGFCWCVNPESGEKMHGTEFRPWEKKNLVNCDKLQEPCMGRDVGGTWQPEPCVSCVCVNEGETKRPMCTMPSCHPIPDDCVHKSKPNGQCCPVCQDVKLNIPEKAKKVNCKGKVNIRKCLRRASFVLNISSFNDKKILFKKRDIQVLGVEIKRTDSDVDIGKMENINKELVKILKKRKKTKIILKQHKNQAWAFMIRLKAKKNHHDSGVFRVMS